MADSKRLETLAIHGGQAPEPVTGAVMPPVFQTSTYAQPRVAEHTGYEYSRTQNPTREKLEAAVASLEGANIEGPVGAIAFASGSAATAAVQHLLDAGDLVVSGDDVYGGTYRQFTKVFSRQGLRYSFVDFTRTAPEQAIPEGTKLVWLESPTNPLLKVSDIRALAERAHAVGALVAVDNTFATPIFQRPLELGADMVVHSTTKYINGHSDVVGGIVITASPELDARLRFIQNSIGAVPGIWDCWLTLRGVKTLAVRMDRHQANARALVAWLKSEPRVSRVWYPMDESHPQYEIAKGQMHGFGGMISFEIDADLATAERFCAATKVITLAESLGGVESLIELPAAMTHASIPAEVRRQIGIADGLVRISVGIEHVDDLIADLRQALDQAFSDSK
ncbi:MAG: PLP-dependent transferase [Alphaproteobacteria bacterium]|nr:PLP-dependent transferase [Alphaproteobacteria bacterium]MCB9791496.1 PLP-dependent transferase [Alphaproteobacteria bacterium]